MVNRKGFTLIEIIIVIVIIGIMATIALPRITGQQEVVRAGEAYNMFSSISRAARECVEANGGNATTCVTQAALGVQPPLNALFAYSASGSATTASYRALRNSHALCMMLTNATGAVVYSYNNPTTNPYAQTLTRTGMVGAVGGNCATNWGAY
jgi:prepilin-type N-terminal cleavage/methylation domain-containing protein